MDLVGQKNQIIPDSRRTTILLLEDYQYCTCNAETGMILLLWQIKN